MKLFAHYRTSKQLIEKTKFVKVFSCNFDGKEYKIVLTNRFANDHTFIHCKDGHIVWQQAPRLNWGGKMVGTRDVIYKYIQDKRFITVFVVKGNPNEITGLDDGVFGSADKVDENNVNVMVYSRFKKL